MTTARMFLAVGSTSAFLAVAAGAFGAHALRDRLDDSLLAAFETGVRYQMYHALALLAVASVCHARPSRAIRAAGICMLIGIVLFTGSLYGLTLLNWRWLGPVTPIGGVFLLVGWLLLAVGAVRNTPPTDDASSIGC